MKNVLISVHKESKRKKVVNSFKSIISVFVMLFLLFVTTASYSQTQKNTVSGVITYPGGELLAGATIIIKGTTAGVSTDLDGSYTIYVENGQTLVFSYLGMESKEILYNGQTELNVTLQDKADELDQVTLVAFGKQKKASVIGSVSTIKPSDLKISSSNLTTALAGRLSGVIAYQRSGEPGRDNAEFFIRGVTTFGYKRSPLILIDNIELTTTDYC